MDGSNIGWDEPLRLREAVHYDQIESNCSGLDDFDSEDLSAGRSVFLPWVRPKTNVFRRSMDDIDTPTVDLTRPTPMILGSGVDFKENLSRTVSMVADRPQDWSAMILHADDFGAAEDLSHALVELWRAAPQLPVMLISSRGGVERMVPERRPMRDVSPRDPVRSERVTAALSRARQRMAVWTERNADGEGMTNIFALADYSEPAPAPAPRVVVPRRVKPTRH